MFAIKSLIVDHNTVLFERVFFLIFKIIIFADWEHRLAQLEQCRINGRKVAGSNLARGAMLCP